MNFHANHRSTNRQGVILLVVLGSLTFFSILVAAYLVFSNESRDASFARSQQEIREPDVDWMMNEALMTLVRGTEDTSNPFYGEDLLSDYYGLRDGIDVRSSLFQNPAVVNGFVRLGVVGEGINPANGSTMLLRSTQLPAIDDAYAGRLITFKNGPLQNRTYRILRSEYVPGGTPHDLVLFELDGTEPTVANAPRDWFAPASATAQTGGYEIRVNGTPRSSVGRGFNGVNFDAVTNDPYPGVNGLPNPGINVLPNPSLNGLPAVLQPNHLNRGTSIYDKSLIRGDVDEDYDAADFNNWFLSHRNDDGSVIPSFHRPSVINYILNQRTGLGGGPFPDLVSSLRRGTFRPLPLSAGAIPSNAGSSPRINGGFTGGSSSYALRTAVQPTNMSRLNQIADALINGQWDVDNDSDGKADSVWVNLGLPTFVTQEGKLIQPLVAPMIEDLGGRLNLNAHSNSETRSLASAAGVSGSPSVAWAGQPTVAKQLYRGLGWGPAEIALPQTAGADATDGSLLADLISRRYAINRGLKGAVDAGASGRDSLDVLMSGFRPPCHSALCGYGGSTDPFGHAATGVGRSGHVLFSANGILDPTREDVNHPYEVDPSGRLSGDGLFTINDLEVILRADDFDSELLPSDLRQRLIALVRDHSDYRHAFTTTSVSDDTPGISVLNIGYLANVVLRNAALASDGMDNDGDGDVDNLEEADLRRYHGIIQPWYEKLFPPELRLGRKLDVNRAVGNLFDDNGNLVRDEPGEVASESEAFRVNQSSIGAVPTGFKGQAPSYTWDEAAAGGNQIPVTGRQLLARHLYVLAMLVRHDLDTPFDAAQLATLSGGYTQAEQEQYTARRLAQWAVNVVDYRDPDAIMTRFAFDPQPFDANGWSVDDDLNAPQDSRFVVWGVEEPQLMFSEGLALHDVRVRDTDRDSSGEFKKEAKPNPADDTTDQVRLPQGSLFLELFCPHPTYKNDEVTKPGFPMELYQQSPSGPQLNLAASAPKLNLTALYGAPVWRIAISERHDGQVAQAKRDLAPAAQRLTNPDAASFEVNQPDELGGSGGVDNLRLERFILFTNAQNIDTDPNGAFTQINDVLTENAIADMSAEQFFIAPSFSTNAAINTDRLLEPGQFLVLAPRLTTYLGSSFDFGNPNSNAGGNGNGNAFGLLNRLTPAGPSDQMLRVGTLNCFQQLVHFGITNSDNDNVGDRATPLLATEAPNAQGQPFGARALPLVIAAPRRVGWESTVYETGAVGLNISEPLPRGAAFYSQPLLRYFGNQVFPDGGSYPQTDAYLDYSDVNDTALGLPADGNFAFVPTINDEPVLGTIENYRSAFLQRLADPTLPYNPVTNPYRTVDWFQLDLTVFSGEEREDYVIQNQRGDYARRSRQRNGAVRFPNNIANPVRANALYSYESQSDAGNRKLDATSFTAGVSGNYFKFESTFAGDDGRLHNSLTFLNSDDFQSRGANSVNPNFQGFGLPLGNLVTANPQGQGLMDANLPRAAYALHPWLNRPFATPYELMMVPACSAGRLFEEFTVTETNPTIYPNGAGSPPVTFVQTPFRHLLNFFHSERVGSAGESPELSRLFEFIHTPPRFRGEVEYFVPARLAGLPATMQSLLKPPFNLLYDNQRQGVVNLNSISSFPVWAGLMQGHLNPGEFSNASTNEQLGYNQFRANRRGFAGTNAVNKIPTDGSNPSGAINYNSRLNPALPTQFAGVFRSSIGARYGLNTTLNRPGVNGTLLRDDVSVQATAPAQKPFFVRGADQIPVIAQPNLNPQSNRLTSPFLRYQTLMRMPNLASNNSQVFVLRMTLGFFEVDATTGELGREYNADAGTSERFKATYVVDRSVPVGFEPGKDLNTRDVVVFESYGQ